MTAALDATIDRSAPSAEPRSAAAATLALAFEVAASACDAATLAASSDQTLERIEHRRAWLAAIVRDTSPLRLLDEVAGDLEMNSVTMSAHPTTTTSAYGTRYDTTSEPRARPRRRSACRQRRGRLSDRTRGASVRSGRRTCSRLQRRRARAPAFAVGEPVAIVGPPSLDWIAAAFACLPPEPRSRRLITT